jgi:hypothetical protein
MFDKHLKISSTMKGDFRKQTHPLYVKNSTTNKYQTSLEANMNILDMQGEQDLFLGINEAF